YVRLNDGSRVETDMVLLSVGVRPTLQLAKDANLELGKSGALLVDEYLRTSDPCIYAAGDMVEITHTVSGSKVRMPLAGPANRQGRIAATNALGGSQPYKGSVGSSIVKVFEAVAGSTGLSLKAAKDAGFDADAVVVHKASHTAYYPGSQKVSMTLVWDKKTKKVLGAQVAGRVGVDKRIDVIATAIAGGLTIEHLSEMDFAYAPPFDSPNGPVNMAGFTAVNHDIGFSPSILAQDFEKFVLEQSPIAIDLRDPISFSKANLRGSNNLSQNIIKENLEKIPKDSTIVLISEDGQKGHVVLRMLKGFGFEKVFNLSGGYISLERHARAVGFTHLQVGLFAIEHKTVHDNREETIQSKAEEIPSETDGHGSIILDVRTPMEFAMGAYPNAINVGLDDLTQWAETIVDKNREIILYCASGARSSYGVRVLKQKGFTNVENGGGLHDMMARR
ncbi:MAG: CoA-disulfide reductase, partial [Spirochaetia bacterium]|nr:CoA-disulfide reductase [Spirochaetia bacterium]